jgi:type I restriction enzyme S subunit
MKLYASQKIPLPPLFEQHRIVAILRQADKLRQLRRFADEKIEQLLPTLFYHMFGDCDPHKEYPEGWEVVSLSSVISSTQYGLSTSLERSGEVGVLRMNNITINGDLDFSDLKYLPTEKVDARLYDLRPRDILFNRTNSKELVGKTGIWDEAKGSYTFASYIIRIRVKSVILPEYLWALLNSAYGKQQVFALGKQAVNMANINTQEFGSILIILPPKNLQEQFAKLYKSVREQVKLSNQARTPVETLFQSLLSQAFTRLGQGSHVLLRLG